MMSVKKSKKVWVRELVPVGYRSVYRTSIFSRDESCVYIIKTNFLLISDLDGRLGPFY